MALADITIKYNPYTVTTEIEYKGIVFDSNSRLYRTHDLRLQQWIEPRDNWEGIFQELKKELGCSELSIHFFGTSYDFDDLQSAAELQNAFRNIKIIHANRVSSQKSNPVDKLEDLKKLYQELQNGPIEEFKSKDIRDLFEFSISSDFEIVVVAPMSSGKSTLINSLLGCNLLPAYNKATTAVITRIRDNDNAKGFTATAYDGKHRPLRFRTDSNGNFLTAITKNSNGKVVSKKLIPDDNGKLFKNIQVNAEMIDLLNSAIDPEYPPESKHALVREIEITGQIPAIPSNKINIVFVDTPGGNNSQNEEHHELMEHAIKNENKSLILYVFDGTHASANDSNEILKCIADVMKKSEAGKQARDRILFVANKMDEYDTEGGESYDDLINNTLLPMLNRHGIFDPNLYLVSAQAAKSCRLEKQTQHMTTMEKTGLTKFCCIMGRGSEDYKLYKYSTISEQYKRMYDQQIDQLMQANPDAVDENRGSGLREIAEICSGIPALEAAICEYIEKYAICIKVKDAHDAFMRKVKERNMLDSCKRKWVSSEQEFQKVRAELSQKEHEYMRDNKLAEYRERINKIQLNDKPLRDLELNYTKLSNETVQKYSNKSVLPKEKALAEITKLRSSMKNNIQQLCETFSKQLETDVENECNKIITEYNNYAEKLKTDGMLNLGGIDLTKLTIFPNPNYDSFNATDLSQYTQTKHEVTGSYIQKKKGLWNWVKRVIGLESGWESVNQYTEVEYINILEYVSNIFPEIYLILNKEARNIYKDAVQNTEKQKCLVSQQLETIDSAIIQTLSTIKNLTSNKDKLKALVDNSEKEYHWGENFLKKVQSMLYI